MSGRPWIKQPTARIDDPRLAQCSNAAQRDYFMLYLLAGRLDADGLFFENGRQLSVEEIAFKIRTPLKQLNTSLNEMKKARIIHVNGKGPQIVDWEHEQINWREKKEQVRERVTRYRERVARDGESVTSNGEAVTPLDVDKKKNRSRGERGVFNESVKSRGTAQKPKAPPKGFRAIKKAMNNNGN